MPVDENNNLLSKTLPEFLWMRQSPRGDACLPCHRLRRSSPPTSCQLPSCLAAEGADGTARTFTLDSWQINTGNNPTPAGM